MKVNKRSSRNRATLAILVLVALLATACGGESEVSSSDEDVPLATGDHSPPLLIHTESLVEGGDEAEILGVLVLDGDCLFVDDNGFRFPVVWPSGTTWDDPTQTITLNDGQTVAIGGSISGGGGYSGVDVIEGLVSVEVAALAAECVDNEFGEIAVLNNTSEPLGITEN